MSKLETILQEEALREINAILAEGEEKAKAIVSQAEAKAERIRAAAQRRLEAERRAALTRAKSAAELRLTTARMQAKGEVIARVREEASRRLQALKQDPGYPEVLVKLAEEALRAVPGAEAVAVHPDDRGHLEAWAQSKGLLLKTEDAVGLGVRVYAAGGSTYVENTLPGRLERAWDGLAAEVANLLWG